jgi:hypothetical protein
MLAGGQHAFGPVLPRLSENLRAKHGWACVQVQIIEDGKHYLVEERSTGRRTVKPFECVSA